MALTEEQKARIAQNRELAIAKRREREAASATPEAKRARSEPAREGARAAAAVAPRCGECGAPGPDAPLLEAFGVAVCLHCKPGLPDFELLTKGDALAEYLLPESTLRTLPTLERQNPRNTQWTAMKLYLRRQLRECAHERWGGEEGLATERARRRQAQWDKAKKKTRSVFSA